MKRPLPAKARNWFAAAVLLAAVLAGWWLGREPEPEAEAPRAAAPAGRTVVPPPRKALPPAQRALTDQPSPGAVDIFAVRTWEPPPPPPTAFAPLPPQAPPLPFRYMGRINEPGRPQVFLLLQGERVLQTKVGDRIGAYRLEKFDGGQLHFRYRPMNVVQTLAVGSAQ